jgi:DNA-binding Lrp family transcriptional regulator
VRLLQDGLPVEREPLARAAGTLGWTPAQVADKLRQWLAMGVIRRYGAVVRHHRLGYAANGMAVFRVDPTLVSEAGRCLARRTEVSHCYQRPPLPDFPYNLFAMTHGKTEDEVRTTVAAMAGEAGLDNWSVLFSVREFKKVSMRYFVEGEAP